MFPQINIRTLIAMVALLTISLAGLSGVAAAQDGEGDTYLVDDDAYLVDSGDEGPEVVPGGGVVFDTPVVDTDSKFLKAKKAFGTDGSEGEKVSATRVRKAFLQSKKAFHEARQEIQDIKKGDESPVEDVPSFFEAED